MAFSFRRVAMVALLGAASLLAACGASSSSSLASDQTLVYPNVGVSEIQTFDPHLTTDLNSAYAVQLAYSGLVTLDAKTLAVKADLAQDVPSAANGGISADGLTYTFKIRPNVKFSNGDPVTANTFAYSIDRALNPDLKAQYPTFYLGQIVGANDRAAGKLKTMIGAGKGLEVVDDTTLKIRLTAPAAYFLESLTYPTSFAVDEKLDAANPSSPSYKATWTDNAVGTGPFMLKSWTHNDNMVFVANPNWYGAKLTLKTIKMPFVKDVTTAYQSYKAKQYDIGSFTSADYADAKALPNGQLREGPYLATSYVAPNHAVAPFDNQTVRQAFAEAVDRDTISKKVLLDTVTSSQHIVPDGMPGYNASLKGLGFNPTDAKAKLQSVYPDLTKFPKVTLEYPNVGDNAKIATQIQSDYQTYLGVNIALNGVDFNKLLDDVNTGKLQFYMLAWIADYPDPQDWLSGQFVTGASNNTLNFSDPNFDALCNKADVDTNSTERIQLYQQAEELALKDVSWIVFSQQKNLYVVQPWVKGFTISAGGLTSDYTWSDVSIQSH